MLQLYYFLLLSNCSGHDNFDVPFVTRVLVLCECLSAPPQVTGLEISFASALSSISITLSWNKTSEHNGPITGHTVYYQIGNYSIDSLLANSKRKVIVGGSSTTISTSMENTVFTFAVVAMTKIGLGEASNTVVKRTPFFSESCLTLVCSTEYLKETLAPKLTI